MATANNTALTFRIETGRKEKFRMAADREHRSSANRQGAIVPCGVRSARFVAEHKKNPAAELYIHGVEKTGETGRLYRLNSGRLVFGMIGFRAGLSTLVKGKLRLAAINCTTGFLEAR